MCTQRRTAYNNVFINGTGIVEQKKLGYLVFTKHREKRKLCYFLSVLMAKTYRSAAFIYSNKLCCTQAGFINFIYLDTVLL